MTDYSTSISEAASVESLEIDLLRRIIPDLWSGIDLRLQQGEVLIVSEHFQAAMEDEYEYLTGMPPSDNVKQRLSRIIASVNAQYPESYVVHGVQNGVGQAFDKGVQKLAWNIPKVEVCGARSIERFTQRENIRELFEGVRIFPRQIDIHRCIEHSLEVLGWEGGRENEPRLVKPAVADPDLATPKAALALQWPESEDTGGGLSPPGERRSQRQLRQGEQRKTEQLLRVYVAQGVICEDEAQQLQRLSQAARQKAGEPDARLRHGKVPDGLDNKLEQVVNYLQIFESMQRIGTEVYEALRFLIRHQDAVIADYPDPLMMTQVVEELSNDEPLLHKVVDLVNRKDREICMMSIRLPPYNYLMSQTSERGANGAIQTEFLERLRLRDIKGVAAQLYSPDKQVCLGPVTDMRGLLALVDRATRRTPFRQEVLRLRLKKGLEPLYRNAEKLSHARYQADQFIKRRLRRLFPKVPREELIELGQQSAEIIQGVEQSFLAEQRTGSPVDSENGELELREEEMLRGARIVRVEFRVAGRYRLVPQRIMPDFDDPDRLVIAVRDEENGELKPQIRRGEKRFVVKGKDGVWKVE